MKIAFISTTAITIKHFILDFVDYLESFGEFECTLITSPQGSEIIPDKYIAKTIFIPIKRGFDVRPYKTIRALKTVFRKEQFDMVIYTTPNASLYASTAAKTLKIPHRIYSQWGIRYVGFTGFKRLFYKKIEKKIINNSTYVQTDSHGNLKFGIEEKLFTSDKASVIWNGSSCGIDLKRFDLNKKSVWNDEIRAKLGISKEAFVIGFVGRITRDKGVNELLEAFEIFSKNKKDIHLIIAGDKENVDSIDKKLWNEALSSTNIHVLGNVNNIEKYNSSFDLFVLPSYREGLPMAVLEAQAMGVPPIVTDAPGLRDAVSKENVNCLVPIKDSKSLANRMETFYSDRNLLSKTSKDVRIFIEENFERSKFFNKKRITIEDFIKNIKQKEKENEFV